MKISAADLAVPSPRLGILSQRSSARPAAQPGLDQISFLASDAPEAQAALQRLTHRYGQCERERADVVIAIGGDGLMLKAMHKHLTDQIPLFGMNRGSLGFLMNEYREDDLHQRLRQAEISTVHPLRMVAIDAAGAQHEALSINEISMLRSSHQAGKLRISVDSTVRVPELICDGILLATPVGSTAYNLSVGGPILPVNAPLLALTPISPFRPRRWRGAVLPDRAQVHIEVLEQVFQLLDQAFVSLVIVGRIRQDDVAVAVESHAIVRIGQVLGREPEVEGVPGHEIERHAGHDRRRPGRQRNRVQLADK